MKLTLEKLLELLPGFRLDHRGRNLTGNCPSCNHDEFGISLDEGHKFGCYRKKRCGFSGNIFTLLRYLGKLDDLLLEKVTVLPNRIDRVQYVSKNLDTHTQTIKPPVGWKQIHDLPYLNQRGFQPQDFDRYPVGITRIDPRLKNDYVIFLAIQSGEIKGWVARRMQDKNEIERMNEQRKTHNLPPIKRYLNSYSDFAKMLYGLDEITANTKAVILVEGIFDKKNTDYILQLHDQDEVKCVASYKAAISEEQIQIMAQNGPNIERVILLYDSDVVKSNKNALSILQKHYDVLAGYHAHKDPGDMLLEDFEQVFNNLLTPIEYKTFKLEVNKL